MEYGREVKKGLIMFLTKLKDNETKKMVTSLQSNMNKDEITMLNPIINYDVLGIEKYEQISITHTLEKHNL